MPHHLGWSDIAIRLALTVVAGTLIGLDRGEHGRPAGLRTTLLVSLAASVSMIQVNLLLPIHGKAPDSFVVMDLMRLPLGILSGMGFIGAGAILRKDNIVLGVTTAATLWFVTVIGLCFGGGQLGLGLAALGLGMVVLEILRPIEKTLKQHRHAKLSVTVNENGPGEKDIALLAASEGYKLSSTSLKHECAAGLREMQFLVKWRGKVSQSQPPAFLKSLALQANILKIGWEVSA